MVVLYTGEVAGRWYGAAFCRDALVATTAAPTHAQALTGLRRSLPPGLDHRFAHEGEPEPVPGTLEMLAALERADERNKRFSLAPGLVPAPLAAVLRTAAAVPVGYVTTYGNVAKAAGSEARIVGGVMARNPLYPIVPCHRVVGADLSLVGYGGSTRPDALEAKLNRLASETRGFAAEQDVHVEGRSLRVYPVEWAVAKAREPAPQERQRLLFE